MSDGPVTASTSAEEVVARFVRHLDVEPVGIDRFAGVSQADERYARVFGGLMRGQAAIAAGRTAPDPTLHSLHAYFLRGGRAGVPIEYTVERTRDGMAGPDTATTRWRACDPDPES